MSILSRNEREIELVELGRHTKIDINNVAIWVQREVDEDTFNWDKWIGSIISPIEQAYFTYHLRSSGYYAGVVVDVVNTNNKDLNKSLHEYNKTLDTEARWLMSMACYYSERENMSTSNEIGKMTLLLDKDGFELPSKYFQAPKVVRLMGEDTTDEAKYATKIILVPVLVAISLMHCKNIELVNKPVTRVMKRRAKRTGIPLVVEKVLVIEPFKRKVINESAGGRSGLTLAMHICRGHFREYSEEKPLFGKYSGKYWIPQHARGNKESGLVNKEYKISLKEDSNE